MAKIGIYPEVLGLCHGFPIKSEAAGIWPSCGRKLLIPDFSLLNSSP